MTTTKKTGYAVAKRSSSSGRFLEVFGTLSSKGGVTHVMDADSYERAAKRASRVLRSNTGRTPFVEASELAIDRKR